MGKINDFIKNHLIDKGSKPLSFYPIAKVLPFAVYHLLNETSGEHFFTSNRTEGNYFCELGWKYIGVAFYHLNYVGTPVYRLYNKETDNYLYTIEISEAQYLSRIGWLFEGECFTTASYGLPIYRLHNLKSNKYIFTPNLGERDNLILNEWVNDGVAFYEGVN